MTTAGPSGRRRSGSGATHVQFNVNDRYNQSDQADSVQAVREASYAASTAGSANTRAVSSMSTN